MFICAILWPNFDKRFKVLHSGLIPSSSSPCRQMEEEDKKTGGNFQANAEFSAGCKSVQHSKKAVLCFLRHFPLVSHDPHNNAWKWADFLLKILPAVPPCLHWRLGTTRLLLFFHCNELVTSSANTHTHRASWNYNPRLLRKKKEKRKRVSPLTVEDWD